MDTGCIPPNCQLFSVHVTRAAIRAIMVRENQIGIYPPKSERGSYEALPTASIATITTAISEVVRAKKSKQ